MVLPPSLGPYYTKDRLCYTYVILHTYYKMIQLARYSTSRDIDVYSPAGTDDLVCRFHITDTAPVYIGNIMGS